MAILFSSWSRPSFVLFCFVFSYADSTHTCILLIQFLGSWKFSKKNIINFWICELIHDQFKQLFNFSSIRACTWACTRVRVNVNGVLDHQNLKKTALRLRHHRSKAYKLRTRDDVEANKLFLELYSKGSFWFSSILMSPPSGNHVVFLLMHEWLQMRVNAKVGADHSIDSIYDILEFMERESAAHQRMKIRDCFEVGMGIEGVPIWYGGSLQRATT